MRSCTTSTAGPGSTSSRVIACTPRRRVEVQDVVNNLALLTRGPEVNTPVVISGAAELYGVEFGVGKVSSCAGSSTHRFVSASSSCSSWGCSPSRWLRNAGQIPFDVFPEFAPPLVEIQTEAPGMSTAEVESLVTVPLENVLHGLPGLKTLRSKSVLGLVVGRHDLRGRHRHPRSAGRSCRSARLGSRLRCPRRRTLPS